MTEANGPNGHYDYYVVRIFRRNLDRPANDTDIVGVVEGADGGQRTFRNSEELLRVLKEAHSKTHPS